MLVFSYFEIIDRYCLVGCSHTHKHYFSIIISGIFGWIEDEPIINKVPCIMFLYTSSYVQISKHTSNSMQIQCRTVSVFICILGLTG